MQEPKEQPVYYEPTPVSRGRTEQKDGNEPTPISRGRTEQKDGQETPADPLERLIRALKDTFPLGAGSGTLPDRVKQVQERLSPKAQEIIQKLLEGENIYVLWGTDLNSDPSRAFQVEKCERGELREMGISPQDLSVLAEELEKLLERQQNNQK